MSMLIAVLVVQGTATANLLDNPGFDDGLEPWQPTVPGLVMEAVEKDGRTVARIVVPDDTEIGWPMLRQERPAAAGEVLRLRADVLGVGITNGYGAYLSCEFIDAAGTRISFAQSAAGEAAWSEIVTRCVVPQGTVKLRVCLILHGRGEAFFDNVELVKMSTIEQKPLDGPVTITVSDEVVCDSIIGFGAEDDGWFYSDENAQKGTLSTPERACRGKENEDVFLWVTKDDWAIREGRIEWMDPDYVRMFCWYKDWNPSDDWETFTFDSPNMQSHCRTLDLYQRLGARVNLCGVEWGVPDPYGEPEKAAKAIGALFEHLIREKGYTCIQDWTLSNEPNGYFKGKGYSFERFVELHKRVRDEFDSRELEIRIVGSDDTGGFPWFKQCVADDAYFAGSDYFASHRYFQFPDRVFAPFFFDDRLGLLAGRSPRKQFLVAEFGFQDGRAGTLENPLMEEYPYALWTTAFIADGLNRGVAGFSIWCLHEVYYPGNGFMNYGLWDFRDNNWKPRPVYHAFAMFSRLTEAGDRVRKCTSSHPGHVLAAVVGDTVFWVNQGDQEAVIQIEGLMPTEARAMTEETLEGDRECGVVLKLDAPLFTAPPSSFGYAR